MTGRRGLTLLEVLVALVVLATAGVALQRLVVASTAGIADDARLTRAMLMAQRLLAEAADDVPAPGLEEGDLATRGSEGRGLRFQREVRPTPEQGRLHGRKLERRLPAFTRRLRITDRKTISVCDLGRVSQQALVQGFGLWLRVHAQLALQLVDAQLVLLERRPAPALAGIEMHQGPMYGLL